MHIKKGKVKMKINRISSFVAPNFKSISQVGKNVLHIGSREAKSMEEVLDLMGYFNKNFIPDNQIKFPQAKSIAEQFAALEKSLK